jgi:hypothetical protein
MDRVNSSPLSGVDRPCLWTALRQRLLSSSHDCRILLDCLQLYDAEPLYNLVDSIGFAWTVRTIGFIALGTLLLPVCFMRMRAKPAKPRAFLDWSAFTDWPFAIFTLSTMLGFVGLYVTMFFISFFAKATGSANASMAFYLIPILNAGSVSGRTIPNAISDYTGPISCE